jgi:hypothetical protein
MVNAERATRIEDEKTAMKIGPRLGASPFETDVLTLEGIAKKAQEAMAMESHNAVAPKGEKVKQTGQTAKKLRSPGEYQKGQFHPGNHGTAEDQDAADEREIIEQFNIDEAQVRLVKKGEGHFHAVHKKTGKKIGDVKKDGKKWHAKGHSPGPSGRTHDHGSSFKSPKRGAKYLSGAWDEQEQGMIGAAALRGVEPVVETPVVEGRLEGVKKDTWGGMGKKARGLTKTLAKGGMFPQTAAERAGGHRAGRAAAAKPGATGRAGRQRAIRSYKGQS